jgi:flavin-dependent dehydrogenase
MSQFKIGGAGISGLTAAIYLAKNEHDVLVYEKKKEIGSNPITYQGLICTSGGVLSKSNIRNYLGKLNIKMDFNCKEVEKEEVILDNGNWFELDVKAVLGQRGGKKSIEYSLYKQAKKLGVKFRFNSDARKEKIDIVATGPSRLDAIVTGAVYEGVKFPKDRILVRIDDRFSPRGCFFWIIPHGKNRIEVMNMVSQPWVSQAKKFYHKAVTKHPRIAEILDGAEKLYEINKGGNCYLPKSAKKGDVLYVGEAAGFQDPFTGYGSLIAIESGFLAAKALNENLDYDKLWKSVLLPTLKVLYAKRQRLFTSIFGSKLISLAVSLMHKRKNKKTKIEKIFGNQLMVKFLSKIQLMRTKNGDM